MGLSAADALLVRPLITVNPRIRFGIERHQFFFYFIEGQISNKTCPFCYVCFRLCLLFSYGFQPGESSGFQPVSRLEPSFAFACVRLFVLGLGDASG